MTKKMILFNGPRHSGKDTAADYVWSEYLNTMRFKLSGPIKAAIAAMFELTPTQIHYLEAIKTEPTDLLFGRSYVDTQIHFSEMWAKEFFGVRVFGNLAARKVSQSASSLFVCSDSGFDYETLPLLKHIGTSNTLLLKLRRTGKSFDGDSRNYIDLPGVTTIWLDNDGSVVDFHNNIKTVIDAWLDL